MTKNKTTRTSTEYITRPAWDETHTVERTAIRHARIARRKEARETAFYVILDLVMVAFILFRPMFF